jgi:hypothetical protein
MNQGLVLAYLQLPTSPPSGSSATLQWLWIVVVILFLVCAALIILMSRGREEVQVTNEKRASAAEALVKTRDTQITELNQKITALTQDGKEMDSENKVLSGIIVSDLVKFWEQKAQFEEDFELAKSELRRARKLIERLEGQDPHITQPSNK